MCYFYFYKMNTDDIIKYKVEGDKIVANKVSNISTIINNRINKLEARLNTEISSISDQFREIYNIKNEENNALSARISNLENAIKIFCEVMEDHKNKIELLGQE